MHSSELIDIKIGSLASNGSGIGKLPDGRILFVPRTLPGDEVQVKLTALKSRWARGELKKILKPGKKRKDPSCLLYDECGGCSLQHLPYSEQLKWKGRFVSDALSRIGRLGVTETFVVPSPNHEQYRNKVTFGLKRLSNGRVIAGFHSLQRKNQIIDVSDECILPEADLISAWVLLRENWGRNAARLPTGGHLRLTLRNSRTGISLYIKGGRSGWDPKSLMDRVPSVSTVWQKSADTKVLELLYGKPQRDLCAGNEVDLMGDTFLQVNPYTAELLQDYVLKKAGSPSTAIDGYCGIGHYGRVLAKSGTKVIGIDVDSPALQSSRRDSDKNYRFVHGPVEKHLSDFLPVDLCILNPPRNGLAETLPFQLLQKSPKNIIYVSCNAGTLARDLGRLKSSYSLLDHRSFDLFPQTSHIETVVTLERSKVR